MLRVKASLKSGADSDRAAILDAEAGIIVTLNSTATYVWKHLSEGHSLEEIILGLADETGEPASLIGADVRKFVDQLQQEGLLES
jgi:hypothetical protein